MTRATLVVASIAVVLSGLTLTALAYTDEDARFAKHLLASGKDPSLYILPSSVPVPSSVPSSLTPVSEPPQANVEPAGQRLNPNFVASSDRLEGCTGVKSRFCKIKPSLLPLYEKVANETGVPIEIMYATAEFESHNDPKNRSDGGRSCGLFSFLNWRAWGFPSLAACLDAETSIRKFAESWNANHKGNTRAFLCRHNAGPRGCRVKVAAVYADRVMWAAKHLYASTPTPL